MSLEGALYDTSVGDLLELFLRGGASGQLTVVHDAYQCWMIIGGGRLVKASLFNYKNSLRLASDGEAVRRVCQWRSAAYFFEPDGRYAQLPAACDLTA
jgi:hypothetical protein